jgi:hypothetical protein
MSSPVTCPSGCEIEGSKVLQYPENVNGSLKVLRI